MSHRLFVATALLVPQMAAIVTLAYKEKIPPCDSYVCNCGSKACGFGWSVLLYYSRGLVLKFI